MGMQASLMDAAGAAHHDGIVSPELPAVIGRTGFSGGTGISRMTLPGCAAGRFGHHRGRPGLRDQPD